MHGADTVPGHGLDALVQAAARGDGDAFGRLWAALSPAVAAYFRAHAVHDVEDLTSEVFLAAFRAMGTVTGGAEQFRGLLFRIAHRRYVDWVRRRVCRGPHLSYEPDLDARTSSSAEDCAEDRLGALRALALLDLLTPDQRQVVSLRVLGDLSLQQTAEVLGKDVGTVKSLQHRGLARLRRGLEQQRTGPGPEEVRPAEDRAGHPYPERVPVRWKPRHV
jgi:RNA polymerase sigma-70 factor (ECF subfamily)